MLGDIVATAKTGPYQSEIMGLSIPRIMEMVGEKLTEQEGEVIFQRWELISETLAEWCFYVRYDGVGYQDGIPDNFAPYEPIIPWNERINGVPFLIEEDVLPPIAEEIEHLLIEFYTHAFNLNSTANENRIKQTVRFWLGPAVIWLDNKASMTELYKWSMDSKWVRALMPILNQQPKEEIDELYEEIKDIYNGESTSEDRGNRIRERFGREAIINIKQTLKDWVDIGLVTYDKEEEKIVIWISEETRADAQKLIRNIGLQGVER